MASWYLVVRLYTINGKKIMKFEWKLIECDINDIEDKETFRAKIPGEWMLLHISFLINSQKIASSQSMQFIPDPNHWWNIDAKE